MKANISIITLIYSKYIYIYEVHHRITFGRDELERFWTHFRQHMPEHPGSRQDPPHVPIGLSGDDTQYALNGSKAIIFLVSYVLHEPAPGQLSRFPWCVLRHELSLGPPTIFPLMRVAAWSLQVCHVGYWPFRGPHGGTLKGRRAGRAGQRLAGGPYSVTEYRGDWKWHVEIFRPTRHYNCNALCMQCVATKNRGPHQLPGYYDQLLLRFSYMCEYIYIYILDSIFSVYIGYIENIYIYIHMTTMITSSGSRVSTSSARSRVSVARNGTTCALDGF